MEWHDLLILLSRRFDELKVPYLVTGSVATIMYGEHRFTNDIDVVVDLLPAHVEALCKAFPAPDFYLSRPAVEQAIRNRHMFNIIHSAAGLKIDVVIAKQSEFDRQRFARAVRLPRANGQLVSFSSPEDVILKKMEFYREGGSEKHLRDISGVLRICDRPIDRDYITQWAKTLGVSDIWDLIQQRLKEVEGNK